jgi:hypothetical protein
MKRDDIDVGGEYITLVSGEKVRVRVVAIENTNDPVPALGGQTPP